MRIIITGGTGFLGKRLSRKLKDHKHEIMSYDIVDGYDILNTKQLEEAFISFKPNCVIHLAACADLNIFANKHDILTDEAKKYPNTIYKPCGAGGDIGICFSLSSKALDVFECIASQNGFKLLDLSIDKKGFISKDWC